MAGAGEYTDRMQRLVRSTTTNAIGEEAETFTGGAFYWCSISEDSSRRVSEVGGMQTGITATIAVHNYPTLYTVDMLRDTSDRTWKIEGIRNGDNELIVDCYTDDTLQDWYEDVS